MDARIRGAKLLYERAVFTGESSHLAEADRQLDATEADLALARGRILHTRFLFSRDQDPAAVPETTNGLALFERAAQLYRALGDVRGEAEALFWIGCFRQVALRDNGTAVPILQRSLELASLAGDKDVMSESLRHLGIAALAAGQPDSARQLLEESTELRRERGRLPGVAANLVGLAYIAMSQQRHEEALGLLDEAGAIATARKAGRIRQQVEEARAVLSDQGRDRPA